MDEETINKEVYNIYFFLPGRRHCGLMCTFYVDNSTIIALETIISYIVCVFDSENLLPQVLKVVEGGLCCDRVDQQEALAVLHVQISHSCELFLGRKTT